MVLLWLPFQPSYDSDLVYANPYCLREALYLMQLKIKSHGGIIMVAMAAELP